MGWIGGILGAVCGRQFGGLLGSLIGAVAGSYAEDRIRKSAGRSQSGRSAGEAELIFLTAVGAMLAKLSKADGHVDATEIAAGERAFRRLGLDPEKREYCIRAFRRAKTDTHTIYEYAEAFASVVSDSDLREIVYDILWDVACADGVVSESERLILQQILEPLRVRSSLYFEECLRRLKSDSSRGSRATPPPRPHETDPYELIGCSRSATDDEVRRAYREKAKKFHPDILRAQGLPEEMLSRANAQMAKINAAWDRIRRERGL